MVRLDNLQAAQRVRVYLVPGRGFARLQGAEPAPPRFHHPHQSPHSLAVDPRAFLIQVRRSFAAGRRRPTRCWSSMRRITAESSASATGLGSPWPHRGVPFDRQLADLGVELGRLALALALIIANSRTARPTREQARRIVENLHLPDARSGSDAPMPLRQFGTVASSRSASTTIFALNAASNFLRDFVIPRSIGCDRAGHFTP